MEVQEQLPRVRTAINKGSPRHIQILPRRRAKTRRYGVVTLVDAESSNAIVRIRVVLARHEAKVIPVLGRRAKDQSSKNNRESLEQLPSLIQKLTQEVKELKTSNTEMMANFRHNDGVAPMRAFATAQSTIPDYTQWVGSDMPPQTSDRKRWTQSRITGLLPDSPILWGLISHFLNASASLTGFIDPSRLISEVEEVEQIRKGKGNRGSPVTSEQFDVKISLILACASLAAVDLDVAKAEELGIARNNIDAFARDLWKRSRSLIAHTDLDSSITGSEVSIFALPSAQFTPANLYGPIPKTRPASTPDSNLLLKVVAVKILLLLAARSFAAPSEYLKLHLDTISSAIEASLDSSSDDDVPQEEREWRWQLWSSLCILDWTSPGIYHNGSYFIRPEMHSDPPSKVPGAPDDGTYSPLMDTEHLERLSQTRYFLEYAITIASLSRRAEDCIIRPGPIAPAQAAELCSELDALDHKLSYYQLLGVGTGRGRDGSVSMNNVSNNVGGRGRGHASSGSHEHRIPLQKAVQVQNINLNLELGLIRFKLFRHEAFHLMHDATTPEPIRTMCMDTCMDACILVLSHCRNIGVGVPHMVSLGAEGMRSMASDLANNGEKQRSFPGIFRRVIQPASSAALVGQVLLHALPDKRANTSRPTSKAEINASNTGNAAGDYYSYAERSMENFAPQQFTNGGGGGTPWPGRLGREKVNLLQWHVNVVVNELEVLQATSPLAKYKLGLHRQCM
ncbi:MAG: hypothetical protein Q9170_003131 [Blastenia crenularia]